MSQRCRIARRLTKVDKAAGFGQNGGVEKTLNLPTLRDALIKAGLNQSDLATKLKVSREAVSKWFAGESLPKPDKLLRMGMLLGLSFEQLVSLPPLTAAPVVSYRKKAHRKTKDEHLDNARETGELLKRLVPYLPKQELTRPPTLKDPTADYSYVQAVAAQARQEMGLENKAVIDFKDLIDKFNKLHAVIIPVLWGEQQHHGNALNIHLPDSHTTWVFLNLDSNAVDFKFWMAHELGHSLAPELVNDAGEDFAESFAQALLFPESHVVKLRTELERMSGIRPKVERVVDEARKHIISPYTIHRALAAYEQARNLPRTDLGASFMATVTIFTKGFKTITQAVLAHQPPEPADYIAVARSRFGSPFFEALAEFCKHEEGAEHYIQRVLWVSLADAKALSGELRK